ncbi:MAG: DUF115 domain-containing protein [bacterium]|nr:DUF115 domain-containing protein [bacterium]
MFEKNMEVLHNDALKRRLAKMSLAKVKANISYCVTPSNDYVLLKDDVPPDDLIRTEMRSNDIIIAFGMGLGYLLDETFNRYPSRIYIYEPDIELLHFVLNNVDISEHLASGRVFITNDMDELLSKLSSTFVTKDKVEIVYLNNYAIIKNKELLLLTQKVYDICKSKMVDINTITKFSRQWMINTLSNIAEINNKSMYRLSDLEGKFSGQTAIIAGAGPSLKDNIESIKANRNKFVLFAVNKVVGYLLDNDVVPDFVVCLDALNMERTVGNYSSRLVNTNCIADIRTDCYLSKIGFKKTFFNFSETDFFIKKLMNFDSNIKLYNIGGTASSFALVSAVKMGFSKIILAGIDLAFKNNEIYAYDDKMNRISSEEILVDGVKKHIVQVKSVTGGMVSTREDYEAFITHFATIIKELNHQGIYNISSFGANIEGAKNKSLDEIQLIPNINLFDVENADPFKLQLKEFIQDEFANINNIISVLAKGVFSPELVATIVKSVFVYQYMQSEILTVLQKNFEQELADEFINNTKVAIKTVVDLLQKNKLI